jgi:hypothetical protein
MKFMAGFALKLGEARGDLPGVNFRTGIPDPQAESFKFCPQEGVGCSHKEKDVKICK